jgi:mannose/fructose/N-acetylgalactosamine-specific phosphotransferase system component IIC
VTVGALLIAAGGGSLLGVPPLLAAALVGVPILVAEISHASAVLIAIPIALVGALVGMFLRRMITAR